jgi:hypothetical protein
MNVRTCVNLVANKSAYCTTTVTWWCPWPPVHAIVSATETEPRVVAGGRLQAKVQHALPPGEPLRRGRLERLQLRLVVRRTEMLDIACPSPRGVHDLHRRRTDAVRSVRTYATDADYEPRLDGME